MVAEQIVDAEVIEGPGTSLAVRHDVSLQARQMAAGLIRPVARPEDVLAAQNETRALVEQALQKGRDFGVIPGTDKPTLLKPGAERINAAFGAQPQYRIVEQDVDHHRTVEWTKRKKRFENQRFAGWDTESGTSLGLYRYVMECELIHRASGVVIGQGIGSCSTLESKYVDRPRDSENTVLKMAQKRALIAATLNAYGLSDQFTQDVEDMDRDDEPFSLDALVGFGKHKDKTWTQVLKDAPDYVDWALKNLEKLSADARTVLAEELGKVLHRDAPAPEKGPEDVRPPSDGNDMIACPKCDGAMWDNRTGKKNPKSPDLKCKDKDCDFAIWLGGWRDELLRDLAGALAVGQVDEVQYGELKEAVETKSPARMLTAHHHIHELFAGAR